MEIKVVSVEIHGFFREFDLKELTLHYVSSARDRFSNGRINRIYPSVVPV